MNYLPKSYYDGLNKAISASYAEASKPEKKHLGESVEDFLANGGQIRKFTQDKLRLKKHEIITKLNFVPGTQSGTKSKPRSSKRYKV